MGQIEHGNKIPSYCHLDPHLTKLSVSSLCFLVILICIHLQNNSVSSYMKGLADNHKMPFQASEMPSFKKSLMVLNKQWILL